MDFLLIMVLAVVFLGSPLWTSVIIALLPRKLLGLAFLVIGIQAGLAFAVWWFYWGGGIGGEADLNGWWQGILVLALAPVGVTGLRFFCPEQPKGRRDWRG